MLHTPSGLPFADVTLDAVLDGKIAMEDLRVTAAALELQAQVAESASRPQLAENLRRAAELVAVPEETILEIYRALRPGRAGRRVLLCLGRRPRSAIRSQTLCRARQRGGGGYKIAC